MGKSITITTYLIDGDLKGAQYSQISNGSCRMSVIPRERLDYFKDTVELSKPSLYILIGDDREPRVRIYIGETENFCERVKDHKVRKTFWQKALVFVSRNGDMTKTDVQYLEYRAMSVVKELGSVVLEDNKQVPKQPNMPEHQRDTTEEFFDEIILLTSFLGYHFFEDGSDDEEYKALPAQSMAKEDPRPLLYTEGRGIKARGYVDGSVFTVLRGSEIARECTPSYSGAQQRQAKIKEFGKAHGEVYILTQDLSFGSPSGAAAFCLGRSSNGWTVWHDDSGKPLGDIYRRGDA